jgi:ribosomal-protein-alanine N-acetyltransferase
MIREYTPDDIIFIEQIGQALDANYKFKINPFIRCFIYEDNKEIAGFVVFSIMYEKAEIVDIAVKNEYIRQGIGTELLTSVINECIKNSCESITLEVRSSNYNAISFYKKHGFREISVRKSYYQDGEDALIMIKLVI